MTDRIKVEPEFKDNVHLRRLARALLNIARQEAERQQASKSEVKPPTPKEAA